MIMASRLLPTLPIAVVTSLLLACGGDGGSSNTSIGSPSTDGPSTDASGITQGGQTEGTTAETPERAPITPETLQRIAKNRNISSTAYLCFNSAWYENGTEAHLIYSFEDDPQGQLGTIHYDYQVGFADMEQIRQTLDLSVHVPGQPAQLVQESRSYGKLRSLLVSGNEFRQLYDESAIETDLYGESLKQYTTTTFQPLKVYGEFLLLPGELFESKGAHTTNTKIVGIDPPEVHHLPTLNAEYSHKVLYKGRERITVPAGTFDTCRMAYISGKDDKEFITEHWYGVNSGAMIQQLLSYSWLSPTDGDAPRALQLYPGSTMNNTPVDPNYPAKN